MTSFNDGVYDWGFDEADRVDDVPSFDAVDPDCERCGGQGLTSHSPCPECMTVRTIMGRRIG